MARPVLVGLMSLLVAMVPAVGASQVDTGAIAGTVTDDTGGALPGVTVTITNLATGQSRTVVTNELGRYQVTALQPARYSVQAELSGFTTVVHPDVRVTVGSAVDVRLSMPVAALQETVTVTGDAPIVESTKTDFSNVITQEYLENIPSKSRDYLDFTLLMPGTVENTSTSAQGTGLNIGGARAKESSLLVDGFYNLDEGFAKPKQRYSQDAIQEFQIVSFGGEAEYGRAIGGIVNAVTKSGGNLFHGSSYGFFRNQDLNARDFGARRRGLTEKSEFNRQQWGATVGGPIVRDKSFFFGAYERVKEDTPYDNGVRAEDAAAIGLRPQDAGNIPRFYRLNFAMGKWDHNLTNNNRLQASFAISRWTEFNQSAQPFRTPSAAYGLAAPDLSYLFKWTGIAGDGSQLHEVKVSHFPRFYGVFGINEGGPPLTPDGQINPRYQDNASPPTVSISSAATFGAAVLNNKIDTYPVQALYASTMFTERHTVKFGADIMTAYYDYNLFSQLNGSYTFSSIANFLAGRYTNYTQAFGNAHNPRWHHYLSGFVQDSWQVNGRLTLNYGARYDVELNPKDKPSGQSFGNDYNNVSPRFAFAFDLTKKSTTFLKVATGVYYDRLFQNLTTFFTQLKGHERLESATWRPTDPGAPVYPAVFTSRPANLPGSVVDAWVLPDQVKVPASGQLVSTVEHALRPNLAVSASVVYTRTWDREYGWDTNLEWDGRQWVRPDPTYRRLRQYRFGGKAEYLGGIFEVTKRGGRAGFNGNLTLARAYESSANYGNQPDDQRLGIEAEWGPQTDTPVVRGVFSAWYNLNPYMQVSGAFRARSGMAVNAVASGIDLNGDGQFGDRTPTFGRNSFRAPGSNSLDLRFTWTLPLQTDRRVHLYIESFNVLDRENIHSVNNDYGPDPGNPRSRWMEPVTFFPPREIQIGARFTF